MTEREMKQAELIEMLDGLNEHGIDCMRFWVKEYLENEKYQASTPPERLKAIHDAETAEVKARAEEAKDIYRKPGIFSEIGKRSDYLKVMGESTPYGKEFAEIYNSPIDEPIVRAIDFFALGCIATEKEMNKERTKRKQ